MAAIIILISILILLLIYGISCILCIKIINNQEKPDYYLFLALIPILHIIYLINSRKYLNKEYEKDDYSATNPNIEDDGEEKYFKNP